MVEPLQFPSLSQVFSLLIVAIGVYAKVQKATGTYLPHISTEMVFYCASASFSFILILPFVNIFTFNLYCAADG